MEKVKQRKEKKTDLDFDDIELFDYFSGLLQNNSDESVNVQELDSQEPLFDIETLSHIDSEINCPITIQEVRAMIHDLKNGKAPGLDMISAELLKNLNEQFHKVFVQFFNRILERGDFPEERAVGIIFLLFKGGDKRNLDNYRGITF